MKRHIAIVGVVGEIKKQIAKSLADLLDMMVFDCQEYISFGNAMTVQQLIKKTNVTYFKKQVSKSVRELDDLQNMVFVSSDVSLLSVDDLQKLGANCYVVHLFDGTCLSNDGQNQATTDENFARKSLNAYKRYRNRCDFSLDINGLAVDQAVQKICLFLQNQI